MAWSSHVSTQPKSTELFSVKFLADWSVSVQISLWMILFFVTIVVPFFYLFWTKYCDRASRGDWEIDMAVVGIGVGTLRLKPNHTDRQIAYGIWVEMCTRKIGLRLDFDRDVIAEVYASWYAFFAVTREQLKMIPVCKLRRDSTKKIVDLSIEILNEGLRPHLTEWQARFLYWYEKEVSNESNNPSDDPQKIQKRFENYDKMISDMEIVNQILICYRKKMKELYMKR